MKINLEQIQTTRQKILGRLSIYVLFEVSVKLNSQCGVAAAYLYTSYFKNVSIWLSIDFKQQVNRKSYGYFCRLVYICIQFISTFKFEVGVIVFQQSLIIFVLSMWTLSFSTSCHGLMVSYPAGLSPKTPHLFNIDLETIEYENCDPVTLVEWL